MILYDLSLDDVLKIVQIVFYIIGSIVAILTYRSAKKGILNTVNTEYKKKVIERLKELSDELASEFDPKSSEYWIRQEPIKEAVGKINEVFIQNKKVILKAGNFLGGVPVTKDWEKINRLLQQVKTDPFLPRKIRSTIVGVLEKRADAIISITSEEFREYQKTLAQGKRTSKKDLELNHTLLHNKINNRLYKEDAGISQIEEQINNIRLAIQDYFESFDPIIKK